MSERIDRRKFLLLAAVTPVAILEGCKNSQDKKYKNLLEGATQEEFTSSFDSMFEHAKSQKNVDFQTRLGGPQNGMLLIRFDTQVTDGLLTLERGFRPSELLGAYIRDESALSIDITLNWKETTSENTPNRFLAASWEGQDVMQFLPPEKYINSDQSIVQPHKMTQKELGIFLARTWGSFNANRIPPLKQQKPHEVPLEKGTKLVKL